MDQIRLAHLFKQYLNKEATHAETLELFEYISNSDNASKVHDQLGEILDGQTTENVLGENMQKVLLQNIFKNDAPQEKKSNIRLLTLVRIAATVLLFSTIGIYFFSHKNVTVITVNNGPKQQHDVKPGGNKAILTLGDGSKIVLNDARNGTLASQGNSKVVKLSNGKLIYNKTDMEGLKSAALYNTMTTPRGGQYQLTLPDGTQVWLNAESSITYPVFFGGKERNVTITGEAYFEVAKNKNMPFYVRSGNQTVRVLGTHFNINSYPDEDGIKTTLLEGSVKVSFNHQANQKAMETIIKPGEQARLKNGGFTVNNVDTEDAVAWKEGITLFNNVDIKSIMRQLCRWYDVDVKYEPNVPERLFTGEISRKANLSEVFKILELSKINFKIQGRTVIVSP